MLATVERARPTRAAICSGLKPNSSIRRRKPLRGLDRVEVLPLQVLDERDLQLRLVIQLTDDGRDALESRGCGRAQASLAGDESVAIDRLGDEDGLQDAVLADALRERGHLRLIEAAPGLMGVRADAVDREVGGPGLTWAPLGDQRREAAAETVNAFGANRHDITMLAVRTSASGGAAGGSPRPERARNSRASSAYAAAPRDSGAY